MKVVLNEKEDFGCSVLSSKGSLSSSNTTVLGVLRRNKSEGAINHKVHAPDSDSSDDVGLRSGSNTTLSFWKYLKEEFYPPSRTLQSSTTSSKYKNHLHKQQLLENFIKTPLQVENLMFFGILVCLDSFLFFFTFLPLHFILAFIRLLHFLLYKYPKSLLFSSASRVSLSSCLSPLSTYDLLQGLIFISSCYILSSVDISISYHYIRGQSLVKLYVIFNMLEIINRLCGGFGQDIFDAVYWLLIPKDDTSSNSHNKTILWNYIVNLIYFTTALFYAIFHTFVFFYMTVTLHVAINSHSGTLLSLLLSNQFIELKSFVFKQFMVEHLFQMTCSDIVERFQLITFAFVITLENIGDLDWEIFSIENFTQMLISILILVFSEAIVDWIKHSFIMKFNRMNSTIYQTYKTVLCNDILNSKLKLGSLDVLHRVSRRIGFLPLPLACLIVRIVPTILPLNEWSGIVMLILVWLFAVFGKALLHLKIIVVCKGMKTTRKEDSEQDKVMEKLAKIRRYKMFSKVIF